MDPNVLTCININGTKYWLTQVYAQYNKRFPRPKDLAIARSWLADQLKDAESKKLVVLHDENLRSNIVNHLQFYCENIKSGWDRVAFYPMVRKGA